MKLTKINFENPILRLVAVVLLICAIVIYFNVNSNSSSFSSFLERKLENGFTFIKHVLF